MKFIFSITLSICTLFSIAGPFKIYTTQNGLLNNQVNCIEKGGSFVWVGTNSGVNRIEFDGDVPVKFSPRGTSVPVNCLEDDGEVIWVGLKGRGVYKMPKNNYKFLGFRKDVLGDKDIVEIEKRGSKIRVTTTEKIIYIFDETKAEFQKEKVESVEPAIVFKKGDVEVRVENGILKRYNEATKTYKNFTKSITPSQGISFHNGYLMSTTVGLCYYEPEKDTIQFGEPAFSLKTFRINGVDTVIENLELEWGEYNFGFQFDFSELGDPADIKLHYQIKGVSEENLLATAKDGIIIQGLQSGSYKVVVKAENSKGVRSSNELSYQFSISSPAEESLMRFIIITALVLAWTIVVIVLVRRKYKKDIVILEDALVDRTNRLNKLEKSKYGLVDEAKVKL